MQPTPTTDPRFVSELMHTMYGVLRVERVCRLPAEEAGMSRIYGGIHYPIGNVSGQELGRCIGTRAITRYSAE